MTFESLWRDLAPIGRSASSGGYFRQPWASAELELRAWFREQADARALVVDEDPFGNLVAWWGEPVGSDAVLTGSHLDSVLDGGAYDGPLGVVSALAAIDVMRDRGVEPRRPLGRRRLRRGGGLAVRPGLPRARGWRPGPLDVGRRSGADRPRRHPPRRPGGRR